MDNRFNEIQKIVLDARDSVAELNALDILTPEEVLLTSANSTSKVAQWRQWIFIFCLSFWFLEKSVIENSKNTKEQNQPNLKAAILDFHYGLELQYIDKSFQYDLTDVINPDALKIIANCAILEPEGGGLVLKVTTEDGPLTTPQLEAFKAYYQKKKVPGIPTQIINLPADLIKTTIKVWVNPEIIDIDTGLLINSTTTIDPVKDAKESYLKKLEFNGAFIKRFFEQEIMSVEGVTLVEIEEMKWKYADFPYSDFQIGQIPESGYFSIPDEDFTVIYLSNENLV